MAITDNCEMYWKMDNDGTLPDSSGNSNVGTITGATYTASGKINGGYSFDASNDEVSAPTHIFTEDNYTISLWAKKDSSLVRQFVYGGRRGKTITFSALEFTATDTVRFRSGNGARCDLESSALSDVTVWNHIVVTRDGNDYVLYVNGTSVDTESLATTNEYDKTSVLFGVYDDDGGRTLPYGGLFDEIGIWFRTLSSTEVTTIYNSGTGLQYPFSTPTTSEDNAIEFGHNF